MKLMYFSVNEKSYISIIANKFTVLFEACQCEFKGESHSIIKRCNFSRCQAKNLAANKVPEYRISLEIRLLSLAFAFLTLQWE